MDGSTAARGVDRALCTQTTGCFSTNCTEQRDEVATMGARHEPPTAPSRGKDVDIPRPAPSQGCSRLTEPATEEEIRWPSTCCSSTTGERRRPRTTSPWTGGR